MLEMRPNCEMCDRDLPNGAEEARICTFECTFCAECVNERLAGRCPNCGGNFTLRPTRPEGLLDTFPMTSERKTRSERRGRAEPEAGLLGRHHPVARLAEGRS
jgi:hypothetical protein